MFCQVGFESLCEFAPRKHDASPAALTFQPNIRAETSHRPLIGTTRMLFAESEVVIEAEVGEHRKIKDQILQMGIARMTNIINES